jgi:hypothetical protein
VSGLDRLNFATGLELTRESCCDKPCVSIADDHPGKEDAELAILPLGAPGSE